MPRIPSAKTQESGSVATVVRSRRQAPPSPEEVRVRAYEIYLARGAQPGRELEDWAQAERELSVRPSLVTR
ncbi:MAG TPA: DUF2934 domain-containing protein [Candidatus Thermoplasmatota archaeon]|nr:DUF2934 domain-containing protein [Candidatus Thermoplasmatota archaeon]